LLVAATLALYNPLTHAPFLNYDDAVYVTDNPEVRAGLHWSNIVWAFHTPAALDWHPLTYISYEIDSTVFGLNPAGYHLVNILLHATNVVLLFLILESATGFSWRSLAVAALFALHPINVESVAWIAERKNLLSMFFFLLALGAYGWYSRRPGVGRYLAVTLLYAFSLMSKAQAITFPAIALLLDYWPLGRLGPAESSGDGLAAVPSASRVELWKLIAEKIPWVGLSFASAFIAMRTGGDAFNYMIVPVTAAGLPFWVRLGNAAISYVKYVEKAFWPANLAVIYPHPGPSISISAIVFSTFVLAAITTLVVMSYRRRPYFVGWFWYLGTLVPMIGLVQIGIHSMADRYAYIPLLGIFVIVCWGAADLITRWRVQSAAVASAAAVILLALGFALHRQVSFWNDNVTLWTHTREITALNYTTEDNLATALIAQGRIEESVPHLLQARSLRPDDPQCRLNLATYEQMHGHYPEAIDGYAAVVQLTKNPTLLANARTNSGYAYYSLKQYGNAKREFEAALEQQPENSSAYRGMGLVAQRAGDIKQATIDYLRSVELQPSPVGYLFLAQALEIGGQAEAAAAARSQAERMSRDPSDDIATVRQFLAD
jgi:Flp pilus assembly protein TadD